MQEPFDVAELITIEFPNTLGTGRYETTKRRGNDNGRQVEKKCPWPVFLAREGPPSFPLSSLSPSPPPSSAPRHTRLTNETLSYVCSNYCRHSACTRSTQRALKYYPRHLAPFPGPHEKPPNGRSYSFSFSFFFFVVVVVIALIVVVVAVAVEVGSSSSSNTLFLPRYNSRVTWATSSFFLRANTFLLSRDLTRA